jgi:hypothetical protein
MTRTIRIPDYGDSGSWYQSLEIPELGEPGYMSPAERIAEADPEDLVPAIIAREQAIKEALARQAALDEPEPEASL